MKKSMVAIVAYQRAVAIPAELCASVSQPLKFAAWMLPFLYSIVVSALVALRLAKLDAWSDPRYARNWLEARVTPRDVCRGTWRWLPYVPKNLDAPKQEWREAKRSHYQGLVTLAVVLAGWVVAAICSLSRL
jgi:hypothetical protein